MSRRGPDALKAAGYDRSFAPGVLDGAARSGRPTARPPGCAGITVDGGWVTVPAGVRLDLGGIGKGYAADLVAGDLMEAGAAGVCVNLGGDVRAMGAAPHEAGWVVSVEDPWHPDVELIRLAVADGAVATSSRLRRTWRTGATSAHHLVDPRTGRCADSGLAAVTVVAADACWAEVLAKTALIAGPHAGADLLSRHGVAGLLVHDDGTLTRPGDIERYQPWTRSSGGTSPAPLD